jgi:hypothetical protein
MLEQHHVRAGMTGSEHGHTLAVSGGGDLVPEVVDLGDRLLEVLLVDLVGRHRGHSGRFQFSPSELFP